MREEEGFSELQLSLQRSRDLSGRSLASTEKVLREPPAQDEDAEAAAEDEFADLPDFRKASPSSSPSRRAKTPGSPTSRAARLPRPRCSRTSSRDKEGELAEANEQIMYLESKLMELRSRVRD